MNFDPNCCCPTCNFNRYCFFAGPFPQPLPQWTNMQSPAPINTAEHPSTANPMAKCYAYTWQLSPGPFKNWQKGYSSAELYSSSFAPLEGDDNPKLQLCFERDKSSEFEYLIVRCVPKSGAPQPDRFSIEYRCWIDDQLHANCISSVGPSCGLPGTAFVLEATEAFFHPNRPPSPSVVFEASLVFNYGGEENALSYGMAIPESASARAELECVESTGEHSCDASQAGRVHATVSVIRQMASYADLVFIASDGVQVKAHKCFVAQLGNQMRLAINAAEIDVESGLATIKEDVSDAAITAMLDFIYDGALKNLPPEVAVEVDTLAHKYRIEALANDCKPFLLSETILKMFEKEIGSNKEPSLKLRSLSNFILRHNQELRMTAEWEDFEKEPTCMAFLLKQSFDYMHF